MASSAIGWRGPLGVALVWAMKAWRARRRIDRPVGEGDVDQLAALVVIGLTASHTLAGALEAAAVQLGAPIEAEVEDLLRRGKAKGLAGALAETEGPLSPLTRQLSRAQVTGAPMAGAVAAFLDTRRAAVRAGLMESARTLPVRLIVPVSLFLLPGFVVLLMGPFVLDQVAGLFPSLP